MNMEEFEDFLLKETTGITAIVFDKMLEICSKFEELKEELNVNND